MHVYKASPGDVLGGDKSGVLFDWLTSAFFFSYVSVIAFKMTYTLSAADHFYRLCTRYQRPCALSSSPPKTLDGMRGHRMGITSTLMVRSSDGAVLPDKYSLYFSRRPLDSTSQVSCVCGFTWISAGILVWICGHRGSVWWPNRIRNPTYSLIGSKLEASIYHRGEI